MKQGEKKVLQRRIRIRILRLEEIIKKIKKLNLKFMEKSLKTNNYYMIPIDRESRKAISILESIRRFNKVPPFKNLKTKKK